MSKRTRDVLILIVLAVALIAAVVVVSNNAPDTTAGLREITGRDEDYYKALVIKTMTAEARATYTPTP